MEPVIHQVNALQKEELGVETVLLGTIPNTQIWFDS